MLVLHELSFGRADFVRASKGALKLGFERFVALKDLLRVVVLGFLFASQVVSHRRFELRERVARKVSGDAHDLVRFVRKARGVVLQVGLSLREEHLDVSFSAVVRRRT